MSLPASFPHTSRNERLAATAATLAGTVTSCGTDPAVQRDRVKGAGPCRNVFRAGRCQSGHNDKPVAGGVEVDVVVLSEHVSREMGQHDPAAGSARRGGRRYRRAGGGRERACRSSRPRRSTSPRRKRLPPGRQSRRCPSVGNGPAADFEPQGERRGTTGMVNLPAGDRDPGHGLGAAGNQLYHADIEAAGGVARAGASSPCSPWPDILPGDEPLMTNVRQSGSGPSFQASE